MRSSKQPVSIPDKLYFRIGDVSRLCSLPAYVLRFWETEFPQLKPNKGGTGQRLYRKRDVEMVLEIKRLLYDEGFTIAGARRLLAEKRRVPDVSATKAHVVAPSPTGKTSAVRPSGPKIKELREEMRALLTMLGSDSKDRKPQAVPEKRETKKTRRIEEPTLF